MHSPTIYGQVTVTLQSTQPDSHQSSIILVHTLQLTDSIEKKVGIESALFLFRRLLYKHIVYSIGSSVSSSDIVLVCHDNGLTSHARCQFLQSRSFNLYFARRRMKISYTSHHIPQNILPFCCASQNLG